MTGMFVLGERSDTIAAAPNPDEMGPTKAHCDKTVCFVFLVVVSIATDKSHLSAACPQNPHADG